MRVLVTGSRGKVGRWVVQRLHEAGHALCMLDKSTDDVPGYGEQVVGDVRDGVLVRRLMQGVDAVVHLAAIPNDIPGREEELLDINLRGTWTILLAAAESGVRRVVYFSSINALGQGEP
uniref:NAD-dependent epimerase/dehydratase family protein n=1 Tax=Bellilinea sp. TaxID=2838785 RepID=UPI002ADE06B9